MKEKSQMVSGKYGGERGGIRQENQDTSRVGPRGGSLGSGMGGSGRMRGSPWTHTEICV